jgi:Prenyltransferase and squalene oxidase repeat
MPASDVAAAALGAAAASTRFLLSRQSGDGSWSDWDLPPGPSDQWTTAYIAGRLAAAPGTLASLSTTARSRAAAWLIEREFAGGGWGYRASVGPDADSTAWALLFLAGEGAPVSSTSYEFLVSFQRPDGGFSTYPADAGLGSWCDSQVDVTAVAARALLWTRHSAYGCVVDAALRYLAQNRGPDGAWGSFWWASPLYATAAVLTLLRDAGVAGDPEIVEPWVDASVPGNPFEQALLLECLVQSGRADAAAAQVVLDVLLGEQLPDGSWPSVPVLRLADRGVAAGVGSVPTGPLFGDPHRLFTTATVLAAVSSSLVNRSAASNG